MNDASEISPPQPPDSGAPTGADQPQATDRAVEDSWLEVEAALSRSADRPDGQTQAAPSVEMRSRQVDPSLPLMLVETAFLASAASLLWLVNYYFPMGPVLRIFFPIPIALIYLRWNSRAAWMATIVSTLLLSILMGPARSVLFLMPFALMGVLLGMCWQRRARWLTSVSLAALLGSIGFFFRIWLASVLLGEDLWLYATTQATDLLDWLFVKLGWLMQPNEWTVQLAMIVLVLFNNLVYLFVVHLAAWFLLDRLGNPIPRPPKWVQVLMEYESE
jgi:uncharacterized protein YybS (DUF2232 family)